MFVGCHGYRVRTRMYVGRVEASDDAGPDVITSGRSGIQCCPVESRCPAAETSVTRAGKTRAPAVQASDISATVTETKTIRITLE